MIRLDRDIVRLTDGRAEASVRVRALLKRHDRLVVDIYRLDASRHPEDHLGWWLFHFNRHLRGTLLFDFTTIGTTSIRLRQDATLIDAADCWYNESFPFAPVQDIHLVVRDRENRPIESEIYQLVNTESRVLKRFYDNLHATDGYRTTGNTFLETMHRHKLTILRELFTDLIPPGSQVLDVGCGNSLFTEIAPSWPFDLVCCDLGEPVIRERTRLFPQYRWFVADIGCVPVRSDSCDTIFAGEIIEHVTCVHTTLREWHRVLRPGGLLIMTTPNRNRLRNRVNHSRRPLGPDHLNEMTLDEAKTHLLDAGFTLEQTRTFYIELFLNWWSRRAKVDILQAAGNKPSNIRWMDLLNRVGHYFPSLAFGMIFVARKGRE